MTYTCFDKNSTSYGRQSTFSTKVKSKLHIEHVTEHPVYPAHSFNAYAIVDNCIWFSG
jgi:hypothetical protein